MLELEGIVKGFGDKGSEQEVVEFYYTTCSKMWKGNGEYSMTVFEPSRHGSSTPHHYEGTMHHESIIDHVIENIWPNIMPFRGRESVTRLFGHQDGGVHDPFLVFFSDNFEGSEMGLIELLAEK